MSQPLPPPPQAPKPAPTPFWQRWWFWAIVVVVILIAAAAGLDPGEGGDEGASTPTTPTVTTPTEPIPPTPPPPPVVVPDVVGLSTADARNALQDQALTVSSVEKTYSNEAKGTVLKQTPRSGFEVPEGTTVELIVAQPFPKVPNVVGDKLTAARRTLERRGFEVEVRKESSSQPKDTVIRQSPEGGTSARPGRVVTLVVAKPAPSGGGGGGDCTPGYSPCLPLGPSDYDCAGGSGNGPAYTEPGVTYRVTGSDPYDLDADNDGSGCE